MRFFALSAAALTLASTSLADQSSWSTATSTRTVFAVTTETRTGTPPAETQNVTSTYHSKPSYGVAVPTGGSNGTAAITPSSTAPHPTFTGAAHKTSVGSILVLVGGAVVALAL